MLIGITHLGPRIRAAMSTRSGGVSPPPFASLNLGYATDDDPVNVAENERRLAATFGVAPDAIRWVYQVHGARIGFAEALPPTVGSGATIEADAVISETPGLAAAIKVADCAPVLVAAEDACAVAAIHAGWRGTAADIVGQTLAVLRARHPGTAWRAWIGPCIGPEAFEIGPEVVDALLAAGATPGDFTPPFEHAGCGRQRADLKAILVRQLARAGLDPGRIAVDPACTFRDPSRFFSHRRDGRTGRMAALVMIEP
ncbi:MAG: peptidoglycan editing factor PgeF [Casimicrobiaceae bacterium]